MHGDVYDDACAYAMKLAEEEGYTFVHPFDDLDVATGQGTIAMEIFEELPDCRLYSRTNRWRRTDHRCFYTCQDAESE